MDPFCLLLFGHSISTGEQATKVFSVALSLSYSTRSAGRIRTCDPRLSDVTLIYATGKTFHHSYRGEQAIQVRVPFGTHSCVKRSNPDLHHRQNSKNKNQSGNIHRERASGRTISAAVCFEATPPPLKVFVGPAEPPLCAALFVGEK